MIDVASFADSVLGPDTFVDVVVEIRDIQAAIWREILRGGRRYPNHANTTRRRDFGGFFQQRREELSEEERSNIVRADLKFVALLGGAALWRSHNTSIIPEHMQGLFLSQKALSRGFDGCQIVEI